VIQIAVNDPMIQQDFSLSKVERRLLRKDLLLGELLLDKKVQGRILMIRIRNAPPVRFPRLKTIPNK